MLIRPDGSDLRVIGLTTGRVLTGLGLVMLVPAALGAVRGEVDDALGFVIGASVAVGLGQAAEWRLRTTRPVRAWHALVVVAVAWLLGAAVGAIPLHLSGHYASFLDAMFDAMSGFATAGLTLINDLDHLGDAVNLWRHTMQFLGGQGLVLVAVALFASGGGLTGLYLGEGRDERIAPNVVHSAKLIWRVALVYGVLGTAALGVALLSAGLEPGVAALHAVTLFMAAFDTGGFAPTSASLALYHSVAVEVVAAVLMVAGSLSFAVSYALWRGGLGALVRPSELRLLALTLLGLFTLCAVGLAGAGAYDSTGTLLRRGGFQVLSAHTGTGFATVPGELVLTQWGNLAPAALVMAMALGGMAGSTTGGIKLSRVVILAKGVLSDVRRTIGPEGMLDVTTMRGALRDLTVTSPMVTSAATVLLLFILAYFGGAGLAMWYGVPLEQALFESTSATAAVGLSVGVVEPALPTALKAAMIAQMWIGRLEFVAVLALGAFVMALLRGRL